VAKARRMARKPRMKLDWVVNEDTYGIAGYITVPVGSQAAVPLTYPRFMVGEELLGLGINRGGHAWPEGEKQFVKAVRGSVQCSTSGWAAGGGIFWRFRIVKKPIDFVSGGAIVDNNYDLVNDTFANERFAWEETVTDAFQFGSPIKTQVRVRATVNQWLEPDESLFLIMEVPATIGDFGSNARLAALPLLRTLMRADS